MNFRINAGGITLGLIGGPAMIVLSRAIDNDTPGPFAMVGLVGGALVGNLAWNLIRGRGFTTRVECTHRWEARPKLGPNMYVCRSCKVRGELRDPPEDVSEPAPPAPLGP